MRGSEEESFVKFMVVYLMGIILFSNTSCMALTWLAYYPNELASLGPYAWAHATYK